MRIGRGPAGNWRSALALWLLGLARNVPAVFAAAAVLIVTPGVLAAPEIAVNFGSRTIATGGSLDFGTVRQGRPITKTLTIRNTGSDPLDITGVTVPDGFTLSLEPAASVAARRATVLRVTVPDNAVPGTYNGPITITNSDENEAEYVINVSIVVEPVEPRLVVRLGQSSVVAGGEVSFGSTLLGIPLARSFTLTNEGNANLVISGLDISGTGFTAEIRRPITLRPGRRVSLPVRMPAATAQGAGERSAVLTLRTTDPDDDEGNFQINLTGTVAPATAGILVFDRGVPVPLDGEVSFGRFTGAAVSKTFTIRNTGRQDLTLGDIVIDGSGFRTITNPRSPVRPGRTSSFVVQMTGESTETGPQAVIKIPTSLPETEFYTFRATAEFTALGPIVAVSGPGGTINPTGSTFDFGVFDPDGATTVRSLGVSNRGTSPVEITNIQVTGAGFALVAGPAGPITRSGVVRISFDPPSAPGDFTGVLTFATNDPERSSYNVALRARVDAIAAQGDIEVVRVLPDMSENPPTQPAPNGGANEIGSTPIGEEIEFVYRISNRAGARGPLTITQAIADPLPGRIVISRYEPDTVTFPHVLAPGASFVVVGRVIATTPFRTRFEDGVRIEILSNDPDENPYAVNLIVEVRSNTGQVDLAAPGNVNVPRTSGYSFGSTNVGADVTRVFTITNNGSADLRNIAVTSANASFVRIDPQPATTLTPGTSTTFTLRMPAAAVGAKQADITIASDDSNGPYVFTASGTVNNWFAFGAGLGPAGSEVRAVADVDLDGTGGGGASLIYAGGTFTGVGPRIARFTGGAWAALAGGGVDAPVNAIYGWDNDGNPANGVLLVVGGEFQNAGGASANRIATWDGSAWGTLGAGAGNGLDGPVRAIAAFDEDGSGPNPPVLYIGGRFTSSVSGVLLNNVARWNGTAFLPLGTNPNVGVKPANTASVNSIAVFDPDLSTGPLPTMVFLGGTFTSAGNNLTANRIVRFNPATGAVPGFSATDATGITGTAVNALTVWDADGPGGTQRAQLVAAGDFTAAGAVTAGSIARYGLEAGNSIPTWRTIASGNTDAPIRALTSFDHDGTGPGVGALVAGGDFITINGTSAVRAAIFNATTGTWSGLSTGTDLPVLAFPQNPASSPTGVPITRLAAGGRFGTAGGVSAGFIALWGTAAP